MRRLAALAAVCALLAALGACAEESTVSEQRAMDRALLVGPSPVGVAAGEGGVFVIDDKERSLRRFDASPLRRQGAPTKLPGTPVDVAVGGGAVWVLLRRPRALVRVDPITGRQTAQVTLGGEPVAVTVGGDAAWVATRARDALIRVDRRTGAVASGALALPFTPSDLSTRDGVLWAGSQSDRRIARIDPRTGEVRRDFRPPNGLRALAAGDDGAAWFAQGDEASFGRAPVEGDYLDLDADTEGEGSLDVAVGPRGAVYVLLNVDTETETSGGSSTTVSFRPLVRVDPGTGEVTSRAQVGDDARALAAGEGAAWVVERATGNVPSGSWRLERAVP